MYELVVCFPARLVLLLLLCVGLTWVGPTTTDAIVTATSTTNPCTTITSGASGRVVAGSCIPFHAEAMTPNSLINCYAFGWLSFDSQDNIIAACNDYIFLYLYQNNQRDDDGPYIGGMLINPDQQDCDTVKGLGYVSGVAAGASVGASFVVTCWLSDKLLLYTYHPSSDGSSTWADGSAYNVTTITDLPNGNCTEPYPVAMANNGNIVTSCTGTNTLKLFVHYENGSYTASDMDHLLIGAELDNGVSKHNYQQCNDPIGVAWDPTTTGNFFVNCYLSTPNTNVLLFVNTSLGYVVKTVSSLLTPTSADMSVCLHPRSLAVDPTTGSLAIACEASNSVFALISTSNGQYQAIDLLNLTQTLCVFPRGIGIDSFGDIVVACNGDGKVLLLEHMGNNDYVSSELTSVTDGSCHLPKAVGFDKSGDLVVAVCLGDDFLMKYNRISLNPTANPVAGANTTVIVNNNNYYSSNSTAGAVLGTLFGIAVIIIIGLATFIYRRRDRYNKEDGEERLTQLQQHQQATAE